MSYNKTVWTDRLVEFPNRYTKSDETSSEVLLTPNPGAVTAEGTPIGATNMNKIENGIEAVDSELAAHKNDNVSHVNYGAASGTNAKTITLNPAPASLVDGLAVSFKNTTQNTGSVTLNVNSLGTKSILKSNGSALSSGNLKANSIYTVRYNGSNFILQGEGGEYGTATSPDVKASKTIGTESGIVQGSMPENGSVGGTITTQGGSINIPAGHTTGGNVEANLPVKSGGYTTDSLTKSGNELRMSIDAAGYFADGAYMRYTENDWIESNIRSGKNMFGKVGSLEPLQSASGTVIPAEVDYWNPGYTYTFTVGGLAFQPDYIIIYKGGLLVVEYNVLQVYDYGEVANTWFFYSGDLETYNAGDTLSPGSRTTYVNSSGFKLGMITFGNPSGVTCNWQAYKF